MATPAAKAIAGQKGIDLAKVIGSGPDGRILKEDVENFKAPASAPSPSSTIQTSSPAAAAPAPVAAGAVYKDIPLTNVRKVHRPNQGHCCSPYRVQVNYPTLLPYSRTQRRPRSQVLLDNNRLRQVLNAESNGLFKLSVNDFVIKASSLALQDCPEVNSSWHGSFIRQ
jgi:pyruvate dehydrogenase E2 component (dihydrolipoamide acetyltransferase)